MSTGGNTTVRLEITATGAKEKQPDTDLEVWINDHPGVADVEPQVFLEVSVPSTEAQPSSSVAIKLTYEDTRRLAAFLRFVLKLGPISYCNERERL